MRPSEVLRRASLIAVGQTKLNRISALQQAAREMKAHRLYHRCLAFLGRAVETKYRNREEALQQIEDAIALAEAEGD